MKSSITIPPELWFEHQKKRLLQIDEKAETEEFNLEDAPANKFPDFSNRLQSYLQKEYSRLHRARKNFSWFFWMRLTLKRTRWAKAVLFVSVCILLAGALHITMLASNTSIHITYSSPYYTSVFNLPVGSKDQPSLPREQMAAHRAVSDTSNPEADSTENRNDSTVSSGMISDDQPGSRRSATSQSSRSRPRTHTSVSPTSRESAAKPAQSQTISPRTRSPQTPSATPQPAEPVKKPAPVEPTTSTQPAESVENEKPAQIVKESASSQDSLQPEISEIIEDLAPATPPVDGIQDAGPE
ncbi:MAG: hypothetical protein GF401_11800 [Chitinivibrionales bacterium]|nr:hypothetical protein [Chitinivibrionales bacterium]